MVNINIMKKVFLLFAFIAFVGCKSDNKNEQPQDSNGEKAPERTEKQSDGLTLLKGDFIYYADAAVLQTHKEVYAVIINDKMHELNDQAKSYKEADTDMVPVEIRGKITPKPENEEGWPFRVEIVEILNISKPDPNKGQIITIGNE